MTTNKNHNSPNVPNLRFPEFEGEWEKIELQDIVPNICSGKDKISNSGKVVLYGSTGVIGKTDFASYKKNIVLVARVGANAGQLQIGNAPCGVTDNTLVIDAKEWNYYIYYFLQHYNLNRLVFGSGQPLITGGMLKKIKVGHGNKVERIKITRLLCLLDKRIATQNKIIEDLKKLKSAISERLFKSVKGSIVLLSDICDIVKGKQINGENLSERGRYYVMNGGTEPSGYYDDYNVEANTISISEGGNSCGYVQFNTFPFWSGGHCYSIQNVTGNVDNLYLYHYLKSNEDNIMKLRIGSGLPNIQKKDLAMFKIIVPTLEQQMTISTFLSSIERKAQIEADILIAMQSEKQHLLRQMFI
ncbi:restriction endonuclease subunit S [Paraprevotella clara]|uniref:restriction endonuclease subunit S n=1 Tax=Paraprevotella clara TaxID=454154 RepID=UPI003AB783D2